MDIDWQNNDELAVATSDTTIYYFHVSNDKPQKVWRGHKEEINQIAWSQDGALLASGGEDKIVNVWSPNSEAPIKTFIEHKDIINQVKWSNKVSSENKNAMFAGSVPILATASKDHTVKLWNIEQGHCIRTFDFHKSSV